MFTHFLKYFPHSAGISVGLRWNHHYLPLPSYWILCPEVWKGNLSLSSFVTTVPLYVCRKPRSLSLLSPSYLLTFHFSRKTSLGGLYIPGRRHGQAELIKLGTRLRTSTESWSWWRVVTTKYGTELKTEWSLRITCSKDWSVIPYITCDSPNWAFHLAENLRDLYI